MFLIFIGSGSDKQNNHALNLIYMISNLIYKIVNLINKSY